MEPDVSNILQTLEAILGSRLPMAQQEQTRATLHALYYRAYHDGTVVRQPPEVTLDPSELRRALLTWVRSPEGLGLGRAEKLQLECEATGPYVRPERVRLHRLTLHLTYRP